MFSVHYLVHKTMLPHAIELSLLVIRDHAGCSTAELGQEAALWLGACIDPRTVSGNLSGTAPYNSQLIWSMPKIQSTCGFCFLTDTEGQPWLAVMGMVKNLIFTKK